MIIHHPRVFLLLLPFLACVSPALAESVPAYISGARISVKPDLQASFPCTKAQTIDEQLICSDKELAQLDRHMSEIFATSRSALSKTEKKALLQTQRAWLAGHSQACSIGTLDDLPNDAVACLANRYRARIAELQSPVIQADRSSWGVPVAISELGTAYSKQPIVTFDPNDNAVALWVKVSGPMAGLNLARYEAATARWHQELLVDNSRRELGESDHPLIAFDGHGNAMAVWAQYMYTNGSSHFQFRHYSAKTGWGEIGTIDQGDSRLNVNFRLVMDVNGNATLAWEVGEIARPHQILASRYVTGKGWGEVMAFGEGKAPQLAVDGRGNVILAWTHQYKDQLVSRFDASRQKWEKSESFKGDPGTYNFGRVGMNDDGNAILVWRSKFSLWTSYYLPDQGWGKAQQITGGGDSIHTAIDSRGNALVAWKQTDGYWFNRYQVSQGWGKARQIMKPGQFDICSDISMDRSGNAMMMWCKSTLLYEDKDTGQAEDRLNLYATRYDSGKDSWSGLMQIEEDSVGNNEPGSLAMDSEGNAVAIWPYRDMPSVNDSHKSKILVNHYIRTIGDTH